MFAYCLNNPVNYVDPTGCLVQTVIDFFNYLYGQFQNAVQTLKPAYAGLAGVAAVDGPAPVADTVAVVGAAALTFGAVAYEIYDDVTTKEREKTVATTTQTNKSTPIYRYGGTNPGNLIPTSRDVALNSGLSFSTIPKPGAAMTTIEAVNSTGILRAVQDGPSHVSVYPIGTTVAGWREAGTSSIWTTTLRSIVVKWN